MTPTRRTRKPGPKKSKLARNVVESSDEESSDAGSVTRCICGESHNLGLMVQCDKCEVWQHCECIGLIQEKLPDHYYCDQCQPENHQLIKTPSGRSKRLYSTAINTTATTTSSTVPWTTNSNSDSDAFTKSSTPASKRRKTTNTSSRSSGRTSRSPAQQQQQKPESSSPNMSSGNHSLKSPSPVESKHIELTSNTSVTTSAVITDPLLSSPLAKVEEEDSTLTEADSSSGADERLTRSRRANASTSTTTTASTSKNVSVTDIDLNEETASPPPRKKNTPKRAVSSSPSPLTTERRPNLKNSHSSKSNHSQSHLQTTEECATPPYWNYTDGKPARESSPPAKIKYPHSKMTFSDMNRRAKQIMECISKMHVEEMKKSPIQEDFLPLQQRPRSLSTSSSSSSLSSASTIPFLDDYATTTSASSPSTPLPFTPKQEETSLEILERVNRELIKFQRKFGVAYQQPAMTARTSPSRTAINGTL